MPGNRPSRLSTARQGHGIAHALEWLSVRFQAALSALPAPAGALAFLAVLALAHSAAWHL